MLYNGYMAIIAPTITAENQHQYREQVERVQDFAQRLHIDLMDGVFTPNKSVEASHAWLPEGIDCDIHVMHQNPESVLESLLNLKPKTIILQAEASIDFSNAASQIKNAGANFGVALLAETSVESAKKAIESADYVLIFSGNLGHQGGSTADMELLKKVVEVKAINPLAEIGWDGGVNAYNIKQIVEAGVDVINVGSAIHFARDPAKAYRDLQQALI